MHPLSLDLVADGVPVTMTCRALGVSTQAFHEWRKAFLAQRNWEGSYLINAALISRAADRAFGYRFPDDAPRPHGIIVGETKGHALKRHRADLRREGGLTRLAGPSVHDDLVSRQFPAEVDNEAWLTDIAERRIDEGNLHLCATKDVYSNRIVGYPIDSRMSASSAVAASDQTIDTRTPLATIVRSHRGSSL